MLIRLAKKNDAPKIVPLFKIILHEMELPALHLIPNKKLDKIIQFAFGTEDLRFSVGTTLVAEIDNQVAGFAFGYSNEMEERINDVWEQAVSKVDLPEKTALFTDTETFPNEWYLDSIAVSPIFRGKGVGTKLLHSLSERALKSNKSCIGLSVDLQNPLAEKLYSRIGYKKVGTTTISGHKYHHMQLEI
ncbi:GNAT family N-acetyltransferase [Liquorilactobacillus uvarum]|nr:GNAT family N-acetyltransferase [Liquorilactobacillus uvarum]